MPNGFIKSFDGTRIYYSVEGVLDDAPPLLFCYGLVCSKLHWSYQMEFFKKKHKVIWLDYRGHHLSELPKNLADLTIQNIVKDIVCLLDELKVPEVVALGHSMGVNVVLEFFNQAPSRIKAMVLANGCARAPLETLLKTNLVQYLLPKFDWLHERYPQVTSGLWKAQGKSPLTSWLVGLLGFNPNLTKSSDIKSYVEMVSKMDFAVVLQILKNYEGFDAFPWLDRINVPTLILSGEKDLVIPKEAQETMHQLIPNSKFELIRNGSHCPQMDIPELVNVLIERFLGQFVFIPQNVKRPDLEPGRTKVAGKNRSSLSTNRD
ncbi:MAG: alpha/beta fold hydrolase [Bacteriovoracia bacterium]